MNELTIGLALSKLAPGKDFILTELNIDSVVWLDNDNPPTKAQIEKTINEVLKQQDEIKTNNQNLRNSALAKLIDLGLTEEEAKAFLG